MLAIRRNDLPTRAAVQYVVGNGGALLVGLLVAYGVLAISGAAGAYFVSTKTNDFMSYFCASRLILEGHGGQIYNLHVMARMQSALLYPFALRNGVLPDLYPPYFALFLTPLAILPYNIAYVVWIGLNCLLLACIMFALERYAGLEGRPAQLFRLATLFFLPVFVTLAQAQVSFLLLGLFAVSFFAARGGREEMAGVALAFALIKPPYVLPLLLVFLVARRWRALAAFAVTALGLLALPTIVLGLSTDAAYAQTLLQAMGRHHAFSYLGASTNDSFSGFAELLLPAQVSTVCATALSLIALGFLVRCAHRARSIELPAGLAMVVTLLVSPHVFFYDLSVLLIPATLAVRRWGNFHSIWLVLVGLYILLPVGFVLAVMTPVNLTVVAMTGFGLWFYLAGMKRESLLSVSSRQFSVLSRQSSVFSLRRKEQAAMNNSLPNQQTND